MLAYQEDILQDCTMSSYSLFPVVLFKSLFRDPVCTRELEGSHFLCVLTPPLFKYYSGCFQKQSSPRELDWCTATSEFDVWSFISFFGLACPGTSSSASANSHVLRVKERIYMSFLGLCHGHIAHYSVAELLHHSG